MRRLVIWLAFLLACGLAMPVAAQDDDWEDEEWEEEAGDDDWDDDEDWDEDDDWDDDDFEDEAGSGYWYHQGQKFRIGADAFITGLSFADTVMGTVEPREEFEEVPGGAVLKYPLGFFQGLLLQVYRLTMGPFDMLTVFPLFVPTDMVSPEPRFNMFNAEHDTY